MKTSQIEMLLLSVEQGSIAAAARKLHKSRSTVSAALNALEDELGVNLLERTGNRMALTDIGTSILDDSECIIHSVNNIKIKCQHYLNGYESILRIVRDDALPESFWRETTNDLKKCYPNTSFSMYLAPPPEIIHYVESNIADVAFCADFNWQNSDKFHNEKLGKILFLSMAHHEHPLNRMHSVTEDDLSRHTEIIMTYVDDQSLKALSPLSANYHGLPFFEQMRDVAMDKIGWTNIPALLLENDEHRQVLKTIKHPEAMNWRPYRALSGQPIDRGIILRELCQKVKNYLYTAQIW